MWGNQLVPQLLLKQPDTLLTQYRHIEHLCEEVWCQNIPDKKRKAYNKTLFFLKDCKYYNNFVYIILKACHWLLDCTSFVCRSQKCVLENWLQTRWGSICNVTEKLCLCYIVSLRIKLSNENHLYGSKSSQRALLRDSYLIFDLTQLLAVGECLLCDNPIVDD